VESLPVPYATEEYYSGDRIKMNEIYEVCSTLGERRGAYSFGVLVGKPEGKKPLGRPRRRWEENIKRNRSPRNGMVAYARLIWLRIGTGGGHL
jgi:hypothetical protein